MHRRPFEGRRLVNFFFYKISQLLKESAYLGFFTASACLMSSNPNMKTVFCNFPLLNCQRLVHYPYFVIVNENKLISMNIMQQRKYKRMGRYFMQCIGSMKN